MKKNLTCQLLHNRLSRKQLTAKRNGNVVDHEKVQAFAQSHFFIDENIEMVTI